jgi:type IV pilus assembly protein PilO
MEQLIERINKLALPAKAGIIVAMIVLITAAMYWFVIQDMDTNIQSLIAEQQTKDQQLAEKQAIADNLTEKRKELDLLDQKLQAALTELPEQKDIEELLAQLNDIGKKSGLEIAKVTPGPEAPEKFFAKIPISVGVSGNYLEVATFLQEIANLKRIVNVSNVKMGTPVARGDKVIVNTEFLATTFRFVESKAAKPAAVPGAPQ